MTLAPPPFLRGLTEEAAAPKYSHVERERRFLVDPARCPVAPDTPFVLIEDRYLDATRLRLRRMTDSGSGRVVLKLSKKYPGDDPLARPMVTTYLTAAEYELLATLPATALAKRAHWIEGFRVDLFAGALAGLVLAEREAPSAAALAAITPPAWAAREVTLDARYDGAALARLDAHAAAELAGA